MVFDAKTLTALSAAMNEALAEVGKAHGVAIKVGNIMYRDHLATAKVELSAATEDGRFPTREEEDFERLYDFYGFKREDLGRDFTLRGTKYKLLGINRRARKQPMIVRDMDTGKEFKMTIGAAMVGLGHKTAAQVMKEYGGF